MSGFTRERMCAWCGTTDSAAWQEEPGEEDGLHYLREFCSREHVDEWRQSRTEPRTVYVAAQYERARALMDLARESGYEIGHDWTRTAEFGPDGHPLPTASVDHGRSLAEDVQRGHAEDDREGVRRADTVIVLGDPGLWGALIEVGMALAWGKQVWVVGDARWSIFWTLPNVRSVSSDAEAAELLAAVVA